VVVVICGERTNSATGVSAELTFAKQESVPYFLLKGRAEKACVKPVSATALDKMYGWTWDNLKNLLGGSR